MKTFSLLATCLLFAAVAAPARAQLSVTFYNSTCPSGVSKVGEVVRSWITSDRTLAPSLLRLHFHDCFVRGCDASVLLDVANGEKSAFGNANSLRGFEVIDDVKAKVEALCPGVMSCADILSLAARDAMVEFGAAGLNWTVPLGRRDGVVSSAAEANSNLPPPFATFQQLVTSFSNKGFTTREMVVLSGSHTVGATRCSTIQGRLYNFSSTAPTDPALDANFAASLKTLCQFGDTTTKILMDQSTPADIWNKNYYANVINGKVMFQSDDALKRVAAGKTFVQIMRAANSPFTPEFAAAMTKLSQVGVLTGTSGQIRTNCSAVV